jgi:CubicO group peptidase (beta-lactamase class C family)
MKLSSPAACLCALFAAVGAALAQPTGTPGTPPVATSPTPAAAQLPSFRDTKAIPETPAYRYAKELAELLSVSDPGRVREFISANFDQAFLDRAPLDEHVGVLLGIRDRAGALEVHGARVYDPPRPPTNAVLVVRSSLTEAWHAIVVEVSPEKPHKIVSLDFLRARTPSDVPKAERLADAQIADALGAFVDRLAEADAFSGTMLFAKNGEVLATRAVGIANRDFDAPVTLDTKFNLGSMNKMFTGVASMQLVEAGKLSLGDPISKYLSEDWLSRDILDQVHVEHLLTHTSGLGSYFNDEFWNASRHRFRRVDDYKPLVHGETLAFPPGTRAQYSNTGMLLAGAVIEKAAGQDYFDYIRAHVTGPAGMVNTDCYDLDQVNRNLAVGYMKHRRANGQAEYENNVFLHVIRGGPAGGGYSTVEDLLRFDRALRSEKLLRKGSLDELWRPRVALMQSSYGLGFFVETTGAGRIVGHTGGFAGISAALSMYVDEGYTVAVLSNCGDAVLVEGKARELILQGR